MSNTAIQMKSHSGKSAGNKSKHNERKDNHIKNPNFQILYKDNLHKFHYKEPVQKPKTTQKRLEVEKGLKQQIATLNAKINTYEKRLLEYKARDKPNLKQIDKIKAKLEDCKTEKAKLPKQQDRRGRPITKRYVEFEFSLTNSNHLKHDKQVQKAFIKSIEDLKQQNPIFKHLKPTSDILHLDQESLHVHNINKINSKKSLTSILKELDPLNSNRNFLSNMQNQFNSIVRQNMRELGLEVERQQKGIKYLPLKKYKEQQQLEKQAQQAQPKQEIKKEKNIDKLIERQEQRQQEQKEQKEQKQQPQQQPIKKQKEEDKEQYFDFDNLADKIKTTNNKVTKSSNLSAFEAQKKRLREKFKEILENQKENQNETQNAKEQEKSNSKKHYRSR